MNYGPQLLLVGAVAAVGVLHTIVPDHWVPITLIARQRGWSKAETAGASLVAGTGHVLSTLLIALVVWFAGVAVAERFGQVIDTASSLALIAFGGWIAVTAWRQLHAAGGHGHSHRHHFPHLPGHDHGAHEHIHGPELQRISTDDGILELSIFEAEGSPRFRATGPKADMISVETQREDGARQRFLFANHGSYWESLDEIPEPHQFAVTVMINHVGRLQSYTTQFTEHGHSHVHHGGHSHHGHHDHHDSGDDDDDGALGDMRMSAYEFEPASDPLYAPLRGDTATLSRHVHLHRHGGTPHVHWHDHAPVTFHPVTAEIEAQPPIHDHRHKMTARTALLVILGSSPMVEGIPAFFAAGKYGVGLISLMAFFFAFSTIATYVLLCVYSTAGLQRVRLGAFERYGEVLSGAFIALLGLTFWFWPVL
jgi:hypothetical protein